MENKAAKRTDQDMLNSMENLQELVDLQYVDMIGDNWKRLRKQKGYTIKSVSQMMMVSTCTIIAIENGRTSLRAIKKDYLEKYAAVLDITTARLIKELFKETGNKNQQKDIESEPPEYPQNLIYKIFGEHLPDTMIDKNGLQNALRELNKHEQEAIKFIYEKGYTTEKAAVSFGISKRKFNGYHTSALKKLRHPSKMKRMQFVPGTAYNDLQKQHEKLHKEYEDLA